MLRFIHICLQESARDVSKVYNTRERSVRDDNAAGKIACPHDHIFRKGAWFRWHPHIFGIPFRKG